MLVEATAFRARELQRLEILEDAERGRLATSALVPLSRTLAPLADSFLIEAMRRALAGVSSWRPAVRRPSQYHVSS